MKIHKSNYKRTAEYKNLVFELDGEEFERLTNDNCYYCSIKEENRLHGIDRKDSTIGYTLDNCVSSCTMCNYVKGSYDIDYFYKKIEHILTYNGNIKGNYCYELMCDISGTPYSKYKYKARKKGLAFDITKERYNKMIQSPCYICGKEGNHKHNNGIDRIDNQQGYTITNIQACCSECNYMKRDYDMNDWIGKMSKIYYNKIQGKKEIVDIKSTENSKTKSNKKIVQNKQKKTKEEIREAARIKKQKQRQALREKYGDEEYKKMKAKELAEYRAKKKASSS